MLGAASSGGGGASLLSSSELSILSRMGGASAFRFPSFKGESVAISVGGEGIVAYNNININSNY